MSYSYNKEKINNLLEDFNRFIDYLMSNEIVLTKKNKYLKRKDLYSLNQLMIEPQKDVTKHNDQERYIELNLFYHLVIAGNLFEIQGEKQGKKVKLIGNVQRLKKFDFLNSMEKYFALLKIFWIESNWQRIQTDYYNRSPIYSVPEVLDFVTSYNPGKRIDIPKGSREIQLLYNWNAFLKYFELFGFWEVFEKKTDSKKVVAKGQVEAGEKIVFD